MAALKPLFRFAVKYRRVFANPTTGLSVPHVSIDNMLTLTGEEITAIETTATTPAQRLAIAQDPRFGRLTQAARAKSPLS